MFMQFNAFNELESPQLILCEISKDRLCQIVCINLKMQLRWTQLSEMSFFCPAIDVDGNPSDSYELIEEHRMIEVPGIGWWRIWNIKEISYGLRTGKEVVALSAQCELQFRQITEASGTLKIYDILRPQESWLGLLLPQIPSWHVGFLDGVFLTKWRTLEVRQANLYSFIVNDLAVAYEAVIEFNFATYEINIYDATKDFRQSNVYLSYDNLIKNSEKIVLTENITTKLRVLGGSTSNYTLDIAGVNPNGSSILTLITINLEWF